MWSFGSVFARAARPLLGLDIGTSQARLVELGRLASGRLQLRCCATEPLEPGWVHAGQVEQFDPVAQALRRLRPVPACGLQTNAGRRNVAYHHA